MTPFELSPEQAAAVEDRASILQIIACAGAGKTEVLARRVARLLCEGTAPDSIVAFTFTEKAGAELKERIERRAAEMDQRFDPERGGLPPVARGLYVGTIHAYCLRLLQRHDERLGIFDVLDEPTHWAWLWRFRRRLGLTRAEWDEEFDSEEALLRAFVRTAAVADHELIPPETLEERAPRFAATLRRYRDLLDDMRLLTFDAIIRRAVEGLAREGALARVLAGQVRHVLVDEFQDLNPAQIELVRRLTQLGARLTIVGDDDQAIYQWRGGDARYFVEFERFFPGRVQRHLTGNRRSVPAVVRAGNLVAQRIEPRAEKSMLAVRSGGDTTIPLVAAADAAAEAEAIAHLVKGAHERGLDWGDIAVLLRSVRRGGSELGAAFVRHGIPYHIVGATNLLARPEIMSLARIFVWWSGLPRWRPDPYVTETVTDGMVRGEIRRLTGLDSEAAEEKLESLRALGGRARRSRRLDLVALFYELLRELGVAGPGREPDPGVKNALGCFASLLASVVHAYLRAAPRAEEPARALQSEVSSREASLELPAEGSEAKGKVVLYAPGDRLLLGLRSFLQSYGVEGGETGAEGGIEDTRAVHVLTVHQAKGLEFPMVIVANLVEGRFPVVDRKLQWLIPRDLFRPERYEGGEMDERRLFYVALTRARDQLALTTFLRDGRGRRAPSRFLADLKPLEREGMLAVRSTHAPCTFSVQVARRQEVPLLTLSFSDLWEFAECGYRYDLRRRGFRAKVDPALGYGKMAHHVLAWLGRSATEGGEARQDEIEKRLRDHFYLPFAGGDTREALRQSLARMLGAYVERYGDDFERIIETERRFEVPLVGARLVGRIDFLLQSRDGRGVEIVEFKVKRRTEISERERHQVRLYAEAARREGLEPTAGTIYNLAGSEPRRIGVRLDEPPPEEFREQVREHVRAIQLRNFSPRPEVSRCRSCDFRRLCPHAA